MVITQKNLLKVIHMRLEKTSIFYNLVYLESILFNINIIEPPIDMHIYKET